jgi:hypothetical protein
MQVRILTKIKATIIINCPTYIGSVQGSTGTVIAGYTTTGGSGYSQLNGPTAIYLDLNQTLYILDSLNYRVQKWLLGQPIGSVAAGGNGAGTTLNKLSSGNGLYVDDQSSIYVSENTNHRVTRWDNTTIGVLVNIFLICILTDIN